MVAGELPAPLDVIPWRAAVHKPAQLRPAGALRGGAGDAMCRPMICAALLSALPLLAAMPQAGDLAPTFSAKDCDGRPVVLARLLQQGPVLLAFFPKAGTSGCSQEMKNYRELAPQLAPLGAQVLAISHDDAPTLRAFRAEVGASFTFVPDPGRELMALYDVRQRITRMAKRVTFLVQRDGRIARVAEGKNAIDPSEMIESMR